MKINVVNNEILAQVRIFSGIQSEEANWKFSTETVDD